MELTAAERDLLVVGIAFLVITFVWVLTNVKRGELLLRSIRERVDLELWRELGEPESMKTAAARKRWRRFVRSGEYRERCSTEVAALIDDHKRRTNRMLIVLGVAAVLLLYRYRDILIPALLGTG